MRTWILVLALLALGAPVALAGGVPTLPPVVDGTLDGAYGSAVATQTVQTQFGDATAGGTGFTNGSEFDALYVATDGTYLYLFVAGNLESNYNKLELFLDTCDGGQNVLRNDNPDVDFNGLNRLSGLRFDAGFAPDWYFTMSGGDQAGTYGLFANGAELLTAGGGTGGYMGTSGAASDGTLTGGSWDRGVRVTIDNANTGGVGGGCAGETPGAVGTGIEIRVPLDSLAWTPGASLGVCVFVNGGSHDYLANQVLPGLPDGTCNLGDPHNVDFTALAGDQFAVVARTVPVRPATWGQLKARYR